jgi:hypothetical protein
MICKICERELEVPNNSRVLWKHGAVVLLQFPNREVHEFTKLSEEPDQLDRLIDL